MNQFFKFLFASCLGTALALILFMFIGFGMLGRLADSASNKEKASIKPNSVLELDFKNLIPQKTNNLPMDPFDFDQEDVLGLHDILKAIQKAKTDPDIKGIYLNAEAIQAGKSTLAAIRDALLDFKSEKKFVYAYANFYTQGAYYVASVSDSILLNPVGAVDFRGYSSMISFYKGMLDKLDVKMRIFYAGVFKSATEPYRLTKMSPENRLQIREYLGALQDNFMKDVSEGRKIPEAELLQIADRFDGMDAQKALRSRLVDRVAWEDEVFSAMKNRIGLDAGEKLNRVPLADYFGTRVRKLDLTTKDKIAVLYAEGVIKDGEQPEPGDIYDEDYVKMLRKIRKDKGVKALVLRVNSPGGSVLASENIYRELTLFKSEEIPVIVSFGDVAASGGYYIACLADSIFAERNTLTGSIGVFGMIPILDETMRNKLGITHDTVRTRRFSAFGSPFYDFSPEEGALIQARIDSVYDNFLTKVATGRRMSRERVHEHAQGRVWSAAKAKEIGFVDEIGGLDRAIAAAKAKAGLEKYRITEYPRTKTGWEQFMDKISGKKDKDETVKTWMIRQELGEFYPLYQSLRDFKSNRGIQARLPFDLHLW